MSLVKRRLGQRSYFYFKLGRDEEIYLGPENSLDAARIDRAMSYVRKRIEHYENVLTKLANLRLAPAEERRRRERLLAREPTSLSVNDFNELIQLLNKRLILQEDEIKDRLVPPERVEVAKKWWESNSWSQIDRNLLFYAKDDNVPKVSAPNFQFHVGRILLLTDSSSHVPSKAPRPLPDGSVSLEPFETALIQSAESIALPSGVSALIIAGIPIPPVKVERNGKIELEKRPMTKLQVRLIQPGFYGNVIIDLHNMNSTPVRIRPGEQFCSVVFLKTPSARAVYRNARGTKIFETHTDPMAPLIEQN